MILLMTVGFSLIEYGGVRRKNAKVVLLKNILVLSAASIAWWLVGYALSYSSVRMFMGNDSWYFASMGFERMRGDSYLAWDLEFSYLAVATVLFTIPMAERAVLRSYVVYSLLLGGFLYPSLVAWIWGSGWLAQKGFHDFAGAGVVHMTAGLSGLWGTIFLGRRIGLDKKILNDEVTQWKSEKETHDVKDSFNKEDVDMILKESNSTSRIHLAVEKRIEAEDEFKPNNHAFVVVGTLIVWITYLFYVSGKVHSMFDHRFHSPAKLFHLVLIAGASGAFSNCILKPFFAATPHYKVSSVFDI